MARARQPQRGTDSDDGAGQTEQRTHAGGRPRDAAIDQAIIDATRDRLVRDGYSRMTIGDIVADANVTRPTLYRRWGNKFDLVVDAIDYGFRMHRDLYAFDPSELQPREALVEAVRRLDPAYFNPDAMVLAANFGGEAIRTPELLAMLREHAIEPRVALLAEVLTHLRERGAVKADLDTGMISMMCIGSYFAAFYRGEAKEDIPERVVALLWPAICATPRRRSTTRTPD
ncbi:TetR/AcrR family transcriptional regulator [Rugosimonospora acidiphila]|uniref:TetR/AcrR family transcriptional regulator n=1 Tax=Rugosimonospora acidiphila TaxID=556531 RepID=A0ABP9S3U3_9ACTN